MLNNIFGGLFDTSSTSTIEVWQFALCVGVSLLLGGVIAAVYALCGRRTKSFVITLTVLPAVVCVVILSVNGNIGAGVAVAGAFSLIRFRSVAGSGRDITVIFLAMAVGLVAGMGYLAYAALFTIIVCAVLVAFRFIRLPAKKGGKIERSLRLTVPEDLDYVGLFDDIFDKYTDERSLVSVKTTNMGSMFRLTYRITEKNVDDEKKFIDELRVRNGNLEIALSEAEEKHDEL